MLGTALKGLDIFAQVLGYLGAISIAIFSFPQLIRVIKTKDTYTVPLLMYCVLAFGSFCFMTQGFINIGLNTDKWTTYIGVTIANVFSCSIALTVLSIKLIYKIKAKKLNITEEEYCKKLLEKKQNSNTKGK